MRLKEIVIVDQFRPAAWIDCKRVHFAGGVWVVLKFGRLLAANDTLCCAKDGAPDRARALLEDRKRGGRGVGFGFEVFADFCGGGRVDDGGEGIGGGVAESADAAEVFE